MGSVPVTTFPVGQTVTLVKRMKGPPDILGNDTWTTSTTDVRGAFAPGVSVEQIQGMDLLITQPAVFLPIGTDVASVDAVQVAGETYEVDGSPNEWSQPFTGWGAGVEVRLRKVTG